MAPTTHRRRDKSPNYDRLRTRSSLRRAWGSVRHAATNASPSTRRLVARFEAGELRNLERIGEQLRDGEFEFGAARAVEIPRAGKPPRPIVMPTIEARIVQRALLDELHLAPLVQKHFENPWSFGCIPKKSRGDAINVARKAIEQGAKYYLRSDIRDFFTQVPREQVVDDLVAQLDDRAGQLLRNATTLELANASSVDLSRFPNEERGVAQGLCLSPLLGNIALAEFDRAMNTSDIRCLRYVDDFLILGDSELAVRKAFRRAQALLSALSMHAYHPETDAGKAEFGPVGCFDFLGCAIQPGLVRPSRRSTRSLLHRLREILSRAERSFLGSHSFRRTASLQTVLYELRNLLKGWRDSFDFCEKSFVFVDVQRQVDELVQPFLRAYGRRYRAASASGKRTLLGLPTLTEIDP